ncbi:MAG TPA: prepilin peptidase [Candidatus Aenigmarchaeota archaeon]|nr:prepilin peptidase [Candidatus Aenigmarchaeota archaeon]
MMLDNLLLSTALVGSAIAGIWDLKTTEIPDQVPYAMMAIGIVIHIVKSIVTSSYVPILNSCIVGLSFLGFGFLMYYTGQWGGGDAKLLSAIGFLLPTFPTRTMFPFSVSFLLNLFFVGAIYMIIYAIALSFLERDVITRFVNDIKASSKMLALNFCGVWLTMILSTFLLSKIFYVGLGISELLTFSITSIFCILTLFFLLKFVKAVEEVAFKKKIPVSELKVGDVLASSRLWEGITKEELIKIKKSGKRYVWVKTGVRFGPSFILALIFTIVFGDFLPLLLSLTS